MKQEFILKKFKEWYQNYKYTQSEYIAQEAWFDAIKMVFELGVEYKRCKNCIHYDSDLQRCKSYFFRADTGCDCDRGHLDSESFCCIYWDDKE